MAKIRTFFLLFVPVFFLSPLLCLGMPIPTDKTPEPTGRQKTIFLPATITADGETFPTAEAAVRMLSALDVRGFQPEAMKAAAVVCLTEIAAGKIGTLPAPEECKDAWGDRWFALYRTEAQEAVEAVWGTVLVDQNGEIYAPQVFPVSWGCTEAGAECPYDETAQGYATAVDVTDAYRALFGEKTAEITMTRSGRVETVTSGRITVTGTELMRKWGLPSPAFSLEFSDGKVIAACRGQGDGVGMSLYGANEDAKRGADFETILRKYYPDALTVRS